ncbi:MAG: hypothetical protein ACK5L5_05115, partial [Bacteroidales bacterium]
MKKVLYLFSILMIGVVGLKAQDKLDLGVRVGARFANYKAAKNFETENSLGYNFGAFARLGIVGNLFVQPEAYYTL